MYRKNEGVTTIVVICVMAIVMALSLSLFLTASVLMKNSAGTAAQEQCRILAVSLSEEIEKQLTSEKNHYEDQLSEDMNRAENVRQTSLWHYVRDEIRSGSWPYYEENGDQIHSRENAFRVFNMENTGIAGEIADTVLTLYWTTGGENTAPEKLTVLTRVTVKEKTCVITDVYRLNSSGGNGYESWRWEHESRS